MTQRIMERVLKVVGLALLYVLAFFIVEILGIFHPYAWTYSAVPAAVIAAWPYYKLCERYPLPGLSMLCAVLLLILNFIFGQGHEILAIGCFVFGFIAEGFRKFLGNYRSRIGTIASYATLSLIPFSKTCVWKIDYGIAENMNIYNWKDIFYATQGRMVDWNMMIVMVIITLVLAICTMWLLTRNWRPREEYHIVRY